MVSQAPPSDVIKQECTYPDRTLSVLGVSSWLLVFTFFLFWGGVGKALFLFSFANLGIEPRASHAR
jgi:hypothetical protein